MRTLLQRTQNSFLKTPCIEPSSPLIRTLYNLCEVPLEGVLILAHVLRRAGAVRELLMRSGLFTWSHKLLRPYVLTAGFLTLA